MRPDTQAPVPEGSSAHNSNGRTPHKGLSASRTTARRTTCTHKKDEERPDHGPDPVFFLCTVGTWVRPACCSTLHTTYCPQTTRKYVCGGGHNSSRTMHAKANARASPQPPNQPIGAPHRRAHVPSPLEPGSLLPTCTYLGSASLSPVAVRWAVLTRPRPPSAGACSPWPSRGSARCP